MTRVIMRLQEIGCDCDHALKRFLDDEIIYAEFLKKYLYSEEFDNLGVAIHNDNARDGFQAAHILNDSASTLGLSTIIPVLQAMLTLLKNNKCDGLEEMYSKLLSERDTLRSFL